jgi:hypothetical protein
MLRGGRVMRYANVRELLLGPVYVARAENGADDVLARPVGRWPALIDDSTWRAVHLQLGRHATMPRQASGDFLLTGLIRCPKCGSRMAGKANGGRRAAEYRCGAMSEGAASADLRCYGSVLLAPVDRAVLDEVIASVELLASTDTDLRAALRRTWQALRSPAGGDERAQQARHLERRATQARERLANAARLLVDGALDRAGYEALRSEEVAALEAADAELARLRATVQAPKLPELELLLRSAGNWSKILHASDVPTQREILATLIAKVVPARVGYGRYGALIEWAPLGAAVQEARKALAPSQAA